MTTRANFFKYQVESVADFGPGCPICQREQPDSPFVRLPCHESHIFCTECITSWLHRRGRNSCPTCRAVLFDVPEDDEGSREDEDEPDVDLGGAAGGFDENEDSVEDFEPQDYDDMSDGMGMGMGMGHDFDEYADDPEAAEGEGEIDYADEPDEQEEEQEQEDDDGARVVHLVANRELGRQNLPMMLLEMINQGRNAENGEGENSS